MEKLSICLNHLSFPFHFLNHLLSLFLLDFLRSLELLFFLPSLFFLERA
jgi:hypothetical protein